MDKRPTPAPAGCENSRQKFNNMTQQKHVPIASIQFDAGTQVRAEINTDSVNEYAERMTEGDRFPHVDLFEEGNVYFIGDGWHRLLAAQKNGDVTFPANVQPGGRREAVKFALSANAKHGMPRTNADKRRAVEVALRELGNLSDREVARVCAVDHHTVASVRAQLGKFPSSTEARLGADGKIRKLPAMRHEPRGEVEVRESSEPRPPVGGTLDDIQETARISARHTQPSTIASNAFQYSAMAISALNKIERGDPQRVNAIREVGEWISRNQ